VYTTCVLGDTLSFLQMFNLGTHNHFKKFSKNKTKKKKKKKKKKKRDREISMVKLKNVTFKSLYTWIAAYNSPHFSNFSYFWDFCSSFSPY